VGVDRTVHAERENNGATANDRPPVGCGRVALYRLDRLPVAGVAGAISAGYFYAWRDNGLWRTINFHLVAVARIALGREASPTAGVIDSQSTKTVDVAGSRGYDAGKKVKGRKRHIITDTEGHLVGLTVHTADIQDRDGAVGVIASIRQLYPWLRYLFADGGYAGEKLTGALVEIGTWTIEIIKRSDTAKGFEVLPRRWVVERTLAWLGRCRRLAKDFEATIASAEAWVFIASIRLMVRRMARPHHA
jgi:putative transposase